MVLVRLYRFFFLEGSCRFCAVTLISLIKMFILKVFQNELKCDLVNNFRLIFNDAIQSTFIIIVESFGNCLQDILKCLINAMFRIRNSENIKLLLRHNLIFSHISYPFLEYQHLYLQALFFENRNLTQNALFTTTIFHCSKIGF